MATSLKSSSLVVLAAERISKREQQASCLSKAGFSVLEVVSTDEVLSALESRSDVRLLIVDPQMPGCFSGFALARFVSRRWPHVPVLISGWPTEPIPALPGGVTLLPDDCPPTQMLEAVWAGLAMSSPVMGQPAHYC